MYIGLLLKVANSKSYISRDYSYMYNCWWYFLKSPHETCMDELELSALSEAPQKEKNDHDNPNEVIFW